MKNTIFTGKTVLVMGLGRFGGGVDVARFAVCRGAKVVITDLAPPEQLSGSIEQLEGLGGIEFRLGLHDPADFERADIIVANPAVPPDNEFLELARQRGKLVTSQVNIFFQLCHARIIGITGANGKSTTAALTAHLLNSPLVDKNVIAGEAKQSKTIQHDKRDTQYEKVILSGNIGHRPLLADIDQITPDDLVVLELSSFQLEQMSQIKMAPKAALLTNLTPNHLDRHGTFAEYCAAKENIFRFQTLDEKSPSVSIFNAADPVAADWFDKYRPDLGRICIKFSPDDVTKDMRSAFPLPGRANLSNLAAAVAIARHFGVADDQIADSLPRFKPLPHRLEFVAEIRGIRWYNDSIATTPQSAIAALEAFDCPRIIIAGGYDKKLPFDDLGERIAQSAKAAILLGQTAQKIARAIRNTQCATRNTRIEMVDSLAQAVHLADRLAVEGDVVLLSPACASYDMFDNFQHRGRDFVNLVHDTART